MKATLLGTFHLFLFCCSAVEAQNDLTSWIRASGAASTTIQGSNCCTVLCRAPVADLAGIVVAPDNQHYAVLTCSSTGQTVNIFSFVGNPSLLVYTNREPHLNHFSPLGLLWAPDSDRLFVKYGYSDIGNGFWLAHDAATGKLIQDQELFQRLMRTSIAERTDSVCRDGPEPVWTLGGRLFENEVAARKAGYAAFFCSDSLRPNPKCLAHVEWIDGKKYSLFLDPRADHWLGYVIGAGKLIDTVRIDAPMYQGVLFTCKEGDLSAKLLPQNGSLALTVEFGAKKIERVSDLGKVGLLVQSVDKDSRYWELLNPHEVRMRWGHPQ